MRTEPQNLTDWDLRTLADLPLVFIDVETTGLSPRFGHRVMEIGILRVEAGAVVRSFEQLIDPCRRIGDSITRLTGISQQMVDGAPNFCDVIDVIQDIMRDAVVVGHSVSFDAAFLRNEFQRLQMHLHEVIGDPPVLDTLRLARRTCRGQRNGLSALSARLGVGGESPAHRALSDCTRTFGVFAAMLQPHGGFGLAWPDLLKLHGRPGTLRDRRTLQAAFAPILPQLCDAA